VEGMGAGVDQELLLVEYRTFADPTIVTRLNNYEPGAQPSSLLAELLSVLRVDLGLAPHRLQLFVVVVQNTAQVLFHLA
jgi:hypothetical protein